MSAAMFARQFIAAAVAPTETAPAMLQRTYEQWRGEQRSHQEKMRRLDDVYEQEYNQPRIAIETARRQFQLRCSLLLEDGDQDAWLAAQQMRPVSIPSHIFTKHRLE